MGDPGKLLLLECVINTIKKENLLDLVNKSGNVLKKGLLDLEKEFPHLLNSTRGRGTFLAISCPKTSLRDDLVNRMKQKGYYNIGLTFSNVFNTIILNY